MQVYSTLITDSSLAESIIQASSFKKSYVYIGEDWLDIPIKIGHYEAKARAIGFLYLLAGRPILEKDYLILFLRKFSIKASSTDDTLLANHHTNHTHIPSFLPHVNASRSNKRPKRVCTLKTVRPVRKLDKR
jgi:hypothetical protein